MEVLQRVVMGQFSTHGLRGALNRSVRSRISQPILRAKNLRCGIPVNDHLQIFDPLGLAGGLFSVAKRLSSLHWDRGQRVVIDSWDHLRNYVKSRYKFRGFQIASTKKESMEKSSGLNFMGVRGRLAGTSNQMWQPDDLKTIWCHWTWMAEISHYWVGALFNISLPLITWCLLESDCDDQCPFLPHCSSPSSSMVLPQY